MKKRAVDGEYNPTIAVFWCRFASPTGQPERHSETKALYSTRDTGHFFVVDAMAPPPTENQLARGTTWVPSTVDTFDTKKELDEFLKDRCKTIFQKWIEPPNEEKPRR
jgi:hypothetical protein